jgi:hypothetical protein
MLDYILLFLMIVGYVTGGYYLTRFIRKRIFSMKAYKRVIVLSFFYSIIFGVGLAGGGGDPGFALPVPIILAGIFDVFIWVEAGVFINGVIIPFVFWWVVIFVVMLIIDKVNRKRNKINLEISKSTRQ